MLAPPASHRGPEIRNPPGANSASDVIVVATCYADAVAALKTLGTLAGKVVVDITYPLTADYTALTIGHTTSAAEEIARAVPRARVVKAFNTVFAQLLHEGGRLGGQPVPVFVAGDDPVAKSEAPSMRVRWALMSSTRAP